MMLESIVSLCQNPVGNENLIARLLTLLEIIQRNESQVMGLARQDSHQDRGIDADDHRPRSRAMPRAMLSRIESVSCRATERAVFPRTPNQGGIARS